MWSDAFSVSIWNLSVRSDADKFTFTVINCAAVKFSSAVSLICSRYFQTGEFTGTSQILFPITRVSLFPSGSSMNLCELKHPPVSGLARSILEQEKIVPLSFSFNQESVLNQKST